MGKTVIKDLAPRAAMLAAKEADCPTVLAGLSAEQVGPICRSLRRTAPSEITTDQAQRIRLEIAQLVHSGYLAPPMTLGISINKCAVTATQLGFSAELCVGVVRLMTEARRAAETNGVRGSAVTEILSKAQEGLRTLKEFCNVLDIQAGFTDLQTLSQGDKARAASDSPEFLRLSVAKLAVELADYLEQIASFLRNEAPKPILAQPLGELRRRLESSNPLTDPVVSPIVPAAGVKLLERLKALDTEEAAVISPPRASASQKNVSGKLASRPPVSQTPAADNQAVQAPKSDQPTTPIASAARYPPLSAAPVLTTLNGRVTLRKSEAKPAFQVLASSDPLLPECLALSGVLVPLGPDGTMGKAEECLIQTAEHRIWETFYPPPLLNPGTPMEEESDLCYTISPGTDIDIPVPFGCEITCCQMQNAEGQPLAQQPAIERSIFGSHRMTVPAAAQQMIVRIARLPQPRALPDWAIQELQALKPFSCVVDPLTNEAMIRGRAQERGTAARVQDICSALKIEKPIYSNSALIAYLVHEAGPNAQALLRGLGAGNCDFLSYDLCVLLNHDGIPAVVARGPFISPPDTSCYRDSPGHRHVICYLPEPLVLDPTCWCRPEQGIADALPDHLRRQIPCLAKMTRAEAYEFGRAVRNDTQQSHKHESRGHTIADKSGTTSSWVVWRRMELALAEQILPALDRTKNGHPGDLMGLIRKNHLVIGHALNNRKLDPHYQSPVFDLLAAVAGLISEGEGEIGFRMLREYSSEIQDSFYQPHLGMLLDPLRQATGDARRDALIVTMFCNLSLSCCRNHSFEAARIAAEACVDFVAQLAAAVPDGILGSSDTAPRLLVELVSFVDWLGGPDAEPPDRRKVVELIIHAFSTAAAHAVVLKSPPVYALVNDLADAAKCDCIPTALRIFRDMRGSFSGHFGPNGEPTPELLEKLAEHAAGMLLKQDLHGALTFLEACEVGLGQRVSLARYQQVLTDRLLENHSVNWPHSQREQNVPDAAHPASDFLLRELDYVPPFSGPDREIARLLRVEALNVEELAAVCSTRVSEAHMLREAFCNVWDVRFTSRRCEIDWRGIKETHMVVCNDLLSYVAALDPKHFFVGLDEDAGLLQQINESVGPRDPLYVRLAAWQKSDPESFEVLCSELRRRAFVHGMDRVVLASITETLSSRVTDFDLKLRQCKLAVMDGFVRTADMLGSVEEAVSFVNYLRDVLCDLNTEGFFSFKSQVNDVFFEGTSLADLPQDEQYLLLRTVWGIPNCARDSTLSELLRIAERGGSPEKHKQRERLPLSHGWHSLVHDALDRIPEISYSAAATAMESIFVRMPAAAASSSGNRLYSFESGKRRTHIRTDNLLGFRSYAPGDAATSIDTKASARVDDMLVRVYGVGEQDLSARAYNLIIDVDALRSTQTTAHQNLAEIYSFIARALHEGKRVELKIYCHGTLLLAEASQELARMFSSPAAGKFAAVELFAKMWRLGIAAEEVHKQFWDKVRCPPMPICNHEVLLDAQFIPNGNQMLSAVPVLMCREAVYAETLSQYGPHGLRSSGGRVRKPYLLELRGTA